MNRLLITFSTLAVFFAAACNKATDNSGTSAQDDLRNGTWVRTSGRETYKDPVTRGDSTMDYIAPQDTCRKDNSLVFRVNFVGTLNLGHLKCSSAEPDTKEFQWQITQDEQHLSIYNAGDYFPTDNVDADILTRALGYLTIRYRVVNVNAIYHTSDTLIYTDVLRRQ